MRSKRSFITMSRYKIATFDLIRHAFGVTPSPQGEGFGLCKPATPTAPHPSRAKARATFPQGKAALRRVGSLPQNPTVHPLRATQAWPTSPYTPGGLRPAGGISIPRPADTSCRFPSASGAIWGNPETPGGLRRKIGPNGSFPSGGTIHGPPRCPEPPADTSSACS